MPKHSPGPWTATHVTYETEQIADANGAEVAVVIRNRDARLIAAAPEMYELLRDIAPEDGEPTQVTIGPSLCKRVCALLDRIDGPAASTPEKP
jgi:hypothetical protein